MSATGSPATLNTVDQPKVSFTLENILGDGTESIEHPGAKDPPAAGWDEESAEKPVAEGFCIECEGQFVLQILLVTACGLINVQLKISQHKCGARHV